MAANAETPQDGETTSQASRYIDRGYVHDMGGKPDDTGHNFKSISEEQDVFTEQWHGRALAITIASAAYGKWNLDASRHARECLPAADYLRFSYYEKWLSGLTNLLVQHNLVSVEEVQAGRAESVENAHPKAFTAETVTKMLHSGAPTARKYDETPAFTIGQKVRTKIPAHTAKVENGHTRLPAYAANKEGVIIALHGAHVLPDSNAHFQGECPEPLYTVCFSATALFDTANQYDEICLDLWQSYLVVV